MVIVKSTYSQNIDQGMLRSAQASQFSTYPIQNIDIPDLAVLMFLGTGSVVLLSFLKAMFPGFLCLFSWCTDKHSIIFILSQKHLISPLQRRPPILGDTRPPVFVGSPASVLSPNFDFVRVFTSTVTKVIICSDFCILIGTVQFSKFLSK